MNAFNQCKSLNNELYVQHMDKSKLLEKLEINFQKEKMLNDSLKDEIETYLSQAAENEAEIRELKRHIHQLNQNISEMTPRP